LPAVVIGWGPVSGGGNSRTGQIGPVNSCAT
jgi:hypothetical protein